MHRISRTRQATKIDDEMRYALADRYDIRRIMCCTNARARACVRCAYVLRAVCACVCMWYVIRHARRARTRIADKGAVRTFTFIYARDNYTNRISALSLSFSRSLCSLYMKQVSLEIRHRLDLYARGRGWTKEVPKTQLSIDISVR